MDTPAVKQTFRAVMNVNDGLMGVASGVQSKSLRAN